MSKEELEAFEAASMAVQDERGMIEAALEKGIEKGILEALRKMIDSGIPEQEARRILVLK